MKIYTACLMFFLVACTTLFSGTCPFCDSNIIEKQCVFENEHCLILVDYAPVVQGHLLIVPKRHIMKAHEQTVEEWKEYSDNINRIVKVFQEVYGTDQYIILEKNGRMAGQSVPHVHFHIIPMQFSLGGSTDSVKTALFNKLFNHPPEKLSDEALKEYVDTLKSYFN